MRVRFNKIPGEIIDKYNLTDKNGDGWNYFEIRKGCYGLPQSGKLAKNLLHKRIYKHGYYKCATNRSLCHNQWAPITFVLLVDDFGVEYVGERHTRHLQMALEEN